MPTDVKNCLQENTKIVTPPFYWYLQRDQHPAVILTQTGKISSFRENGSS